MMKLNLLLVITSSLLLSACKKNSTPKDLPQAPIGEINIKLGDSTTGGILAYNIIKTSENNFVISGAKWLYDTSVGYLNYFPFRLSINDNLNVASSKTRLTNDVGVAIQSIRSGNFIYTLINIGNPSTNTSANNVRIIKTDTLNNIIWSKLIDNVVRASSLTILSNGNILIQGCFGTDKLNIQNNPLFLLKINSNGDVLFRRDFIGQFYYGSKDVVEEANNYTLVAYQAGNNPNVKTFVPILLKIDFLGNILSSTQLDALMGNSEHYFTSFHLLKNKDGGYILTTSNTDIIDPTVGGVINEYFFIKTLRSDGVIVKSIDLTTTGNHKVIFQISDIIQTKNGNIYTLICCQTTSRWYTEILKFDSQANYLDYKDMLPEKFPVGLCETDNNNFIMLFNYSSGNSITVLKMDPNLNTL